MKEHLLVFPVWAHLNTRMSELVCNDTSMMIGDHYFCDSLARATTSLSESGSVSFIGIGWAIWPANTGRNCGSPAPSSVCLRNNFTLLVSIGVWSFELVGGSPLTRSQPQATITQIVANSHQIN